MQKKKNLTYVISNISKVVMFEWISQTYDKESFSLSFIFLNDQIPEIQYFLEEHRFPCYFIKYTSKKDIPRTIFKVKRIFKQENTDIVHAHLFDASIVGLIAASISGIKKRIHTRHHALMHHERFPKGVLMDNIINWLSTDIVVISKNVQAIVETKEHFHKGKVHLIYHGFDLDEFQYVPQEKIDAIKEKYHLSSIPVIGVISRYVYWKGVDYIINAFTKLLEDYPDAILTIANAKGPDEKEIKELLSEIPSQNLVEIVYEKDMPAYYKNMSVFVHVPIDAKSEAFGQIYVEAMAAGIPGVYTLSGVATEYIENYKNALVVDYKNSDEIYNAIKIYLEDDALKNRIVKQAKEDVFNLFSLQRMNEELKKIYLS